MTQREAALRLIRGAVLDRLSASFRQFLGQVPRDQMPRLEAVVEEALGAVHLQPAWRELADLE